MPKLLNAKSIVTSALICAAVVFTLAKAVTAAPASDQPPIPGAVRVIALSPDNSTGEPGVVGGVEKPWLSDHEVLHFRHGSLYRYDVTARTDTALTQLTRQVMSSHCYLYFLDASPDGQQVIWGMSANNPLFVATVDGKRREQWPSDGGMSEPHWCADGQHWMQFNFGGPPEKMRWTSIQMHSLDSPQASETFPSPPPGLNGLDILAAPSADLIIARTPDPVKFVTPKPSKGVRHADGTVSFVIEEKVIRHITPVISVWSLHQPQPLHRWQIRVPGSVQEVAVSPNGKRLAWLVTPPMPKPHPLFPSTYASLWVSGLDGTGMRKLGDFAAPHREANAANFPSQVLWVPGGKRLSFVYGGVLWVVPVE